ncbi:hypothetical protein BSKO_11553 [Bryopsis sp. KO-2023]|nr:hypothetical protein BSKO_11553 [Bryopsis sp. KO-2023]
MKASTLIATTLLSTIIAVTGGWTFWRSKNRKPAKPSRNALDARTGAIVPYFPPAAAAVEEVVDERVVPWHQSLFVQFHEVLCQLDTWMSGGRPVGSLALQGPVTAFLVDFSTGLVVHTRAGGAGIRPTDGDGLLLITPDSIFQQAPINDFHFRLVNAAASSLPLHAYHDVISAFFAEYGVVFPYDPQAAPYVMVQLASLFCRAPDMYSIGNGAAAASGLPPKKFLVSDKKSNEKKLKAWWLEKARFLAAIWALRCHDILLAPCWGIGFPFRGRLLCDRGLIAAVG